MKKLLIAIGLLSTTLFACEDEDKYVWNEEDSFHCVRFENLIFMPDQVLFRDTSSEYADEVDTLLFSEGEYLITLKH